MLSDEEKKAIDNMESLLLYSKEHEYFSPFQEQEIDDMNIVLNIVEKQSKEIEELKDMNERQKYRIEPVSEDNIEERGDSIDESTMLTQIKLKLQEKNIPIETLLAEFERLEDLEDDLTTVYLNGVYDGEKKVKDKIKAKIEEKIEWCIKASNSGLNAIQYACSKEDEIERIERQKNISTMISILEEILQELLDERSNTDEH